MSVADLREALKWPLSVHDGQRLTPGEAAPTGLGRTGPAPREALHTILGGAA